MNGLRPLEVSMNNLLSWSVLITRDNCGKSNYVIVLYHLMCVCVCETHTHTHTHTHTDVLFLFWMKNESSYYSGV